MLYGKHRITGGNLSMSDTYYSAADMYADKYRSSQADTQQTPEEERGISTRLLVKLALSIILFVSFFSLKDAESKALQNVYQVVYDRVFVDHMDTTVLYERIKAFTVKASDTVTVWFNLDNDANEP